MEIREYTGQQRSSMQREMILEKLRERGCRITRQRLNLIDVILENECSSCKEIFYKAQEQDDRVGVATVYRMINLLEEIGAINRKNMYRVEYGENSLLDTAAQESACTIELDDGTVHRLSANHWNQVLRTGLEAYGYLKSQDIASVMLSPVPA